MQQSPTASETEFIPYPTHFDKLNILPADGHRLSQLEIYRNQKLINDITFQLSNWLQLPAIQEAYDLIIIDSPPTRGIFTIATSNALTHLVIPIEPTKFSLDGLESQVNEWYQSTITRPEEFPIELVGVFPNKVRHNVKKEKDIIAALRNHPAFGNLIFPIEAHLRKDIQDACEPLYDTRDPDTLELRKSINQYQSIFNYPDKNKAKQEMVAVCDYIYKEIFNG